MNLLNLHFHKASDKSQHLQVYCVKSPLLSTEDSSVLHHITTAEHRGQFCITSHHHCQGQMAVLYYITSPLPRVDDSSVLHHITTAKDDSSVLHHITTAKGRWQFCITSHHHCQGQRTVLYYITSPLPRVDDSFLLPEVSPEDRKRPRRGWLALEHKGHWITSSDESGTDNI